MFSRLTNSIDKFLGNIPLIYKERGKAIVTKAKISKEEFETAASNGISRQVVYHRYKVMGWDIIKAITEPVRKKSKERRSGISSDDYAIAAKNGILRQTVYHRVKAMGWDLEKAITVPNVIKHKRLGLTEEHYKVAKQNGISRNVAYMRYERRYWSKEDAITKPIGTRLKEVLTKENYEIAKENGISPQTAYHRHTKLKWPIEKCITEPIAEKSGWEEWGEIATNAGIPYKTFVKRRKRGMTPKEAATTPKARPYGLKKSV